MNEQPESIVEEPSSARKPIGLRTIIPVALIALVEMTLFTYLLLAGKTGEASYVILSCLVTITCLTLLTMPRLLELDLKSMKLKLAEMKDIQQSIYAKERDLKKASKVLAELVVYNMSWQGRALGDGHWKEFHTFTKEKTRELLTNLGLPVSEVERICDLDAFVESDKQHQSQTSAQGQ